MSLNLLGNRGELSLIFGFPIEDNDEIFNYFTEQISTLSRNNINPYHFDSFANYCLHCRLIPNKANINRYVKEIFKYVEDNPEYAARKNIKLPSQEKTFRAEKTFAEIVKKVGEHNQSLLTSDNEINVWGQKQTAKEYIKFILISRIRKFLEKNSTNKYNDNDMKAIIEFLKLKLASESAISIIFPHEFTSQKPEQLTHYRLIHKIELKEYGLEKGYIQDIDKRNKTELDLYKNIGLSSDITTEFEENIIARPVYGRLSLLGSDMPYNVPETMQDYGDSVIVLKQTMKNKCTYTAGDSYNLQAGSYCEDNNKYSLSINQNREIFYPTILDDLSIMIFQMEDEQLKSLLEWAFGINYGDLKSGFIEAQLPIIDYTDPNTVDYIYENSNNVHEETVKIFGQRNIVIDHKAHGTFDKDFKNFQELLKSDNHENISQIKALMRKYDFMVKLRSTKGESMPELAAKYGNLSALKIFLEQFAIRKKTELLNIYQKNLLLGVLAACCNEFIMQYLCNIYNISLQDKDILGHSIFELALEHSNFYIINEIIRSDNKILTTDNIALIANKILNDDDFINITQDSIDIILLILHHLKRNNHEHYNHIIYKIKSKILNEEAILAFDKVLKYTNTDSFIAYYSQSNCQAEKIISNYLSYKKEHKNENYSLWQNLFYHIRGFIKTTITNNWLKTIYPSIFGQPHTEGYYEDKKKTIAYDENNRYFQAKVVKFEEYVNSACR